MDEALDLNKVFDTMRTEILSIPHRHRLMHPIDHTV